MPPSDHDLTVSFRASEFWCKCGRCSGGKMDTAFMDKLQLIRTLFKRPMKVTSGYRCNNHNMAVKGSPNSQHLFGLAADIHCVDATERHILVALGIQVGMVGIGIDKAFIHFDTRKEGVRKLWLY